MKRVSKEYSTLFNEVTDVSEELLTLINRLKAAQQQTEELFINDEEELIQEKSTQD